MLRWTPKDIDQLRRVLEDQPGDRKVEADQDTGVTERTVDQLRARPMWPGDLVITTPREDYSEGVVKISRRS
jgi:hypothetical protein